MTTNDDVDEQTDYGEAIGRSFFEKVLLGIIDAHSLKTAKPASDSQQRLERLRRAKSALLDETSSEGRPAADDTEILRWIGCQHYKDVGNRTARRFMKKPLGAKPRSIRTLVDQAIDHFSLNESDCERIRKKFNSQKEKWRIDAQYHDDIPETLEHQSLKEVQKLFEQHGIKMVLRSTGD